MADVHTTILRKLAKHSFLTGDDAFAVRTLSAQIRSVDSEEDLVRQGDMPQMSIVILEGTLARYHMLENGDKQYLSVHIAGDMPDTQGLFLRVMDHAVGALDRSVVALIPHKDFLNLFLVRPSVAFAVWRETLIDAAIFRQAITNNAARSSIVRMAHFFCEHYYRSRAAGLGARGYCSLPMNQMQIGQTLGMSIVTANRTLRELRRAKRAHLYRGTLKVLNWEELAKIAQFDPSYLHMRNQPTL